MQGCFPCKQNLQMKLREASYTIFESVKISQHKVIFQKHICMSKLSAGIVDEGLWNFALQKKEELE